MCRKVGMCDSGSGFQGLFWRIDSTVASLCFIGTVAAWYVDLADVLDCDHPERTDLLIRIKELWWC